VARALDLKKRHPLKANEPVPTAIDFSLGRESQCPDIYEYSDFETKNPLMGMPFGLPAVSEKEDATLRRWLQQGAPYDAPPSLSKASQQQIQQWETFLNGDSKREQLVSRYLYEHLFLANLYFESELALRFFRLIRSTTPPSQAAREIPSRRPFDDPGVPRVYYRLQAINESIVAKTHMPYALSAQRMSRWTELFFNPSYRVDTLPNYEPKLAANPFETYQSIPVNSRYEFLLDEAAFSIMGFIKGPVCRGQTALNVINDHFWVFFKSPDYVGNNYSDYLDTTSHLLTLPAELQSNPLSLIASLHYSHQERAYIRAKSNHLENRLAKPGMVSMNLIWDGDKSNSNVALTIYRHFDNATVVKGLVGEKPKTAWVITYSLLERIHYLLIAGFDVFGSLDHQLNTRLYMNFLRMEGEFNFISLLPQASRIAVRDQWNRNVSQDVKDFVYGKDAHFDRETDIDFSGYGPPAQELMGILADHLEPALSHEHDITKLMDVDLVHQLNTLSNVSGAGLQWLPEASFLRIESPDQMAINFTLLRNTAHLNVTHLLTENKTLVPEENSLDVLSGIATDYPNAFYRVRRSDFAVFIHQIENLSSEADYIRLVERFAVRRTSPDFWALSDALNTEYRQSRPIRAGVIDLNRLENR
jgi:hypothetical protein